MPCHSISLKSILDVPKVIDLKRNRSVSGDDDLNLYYKFNEPYGDFPGNNIVLDSSGNSLTSMIENCKKFLVKSLPPSSNKFLQPNV